MIVLTILFKDGEQKIGLSVALTVLNGLQETLVLWETSMCGDRSWGGGKVWEKEYLYCLTQDIWVGRHR